MEVLCPENQLEPIEAAELLTRVMEKKNEGLRLSQMCAVCAGDGYELSYSFADDASYQYTTLRVAIGRETEVPSITAFYPYAFLYENEMRELFGVRIEMMNLDYRDKLYRISAKTPFLKKEGEEK